MKRSIQEVPGADISASYNGIWKLNAKRLFIRRSIKHYCYFRLETV